VVKDAAASHANCHISTSAFSTQKRMSISRYIAVAEVRCSRAARSCLFAGKACRGRGGGWQLINQQIVPRERAMRTKVSWKMLVLSITAAASIGGPGEPAQAAQIAYEGFRPSFPIYDGGTGFTASWVLGGFNASAARYTTRETGPSEGSDCGAGANRPRTGASQCRRSGARVGRLGGNGRDTLPPH
jgi:hypothetical protein